MHSSLNPFQLTKIDEFRSFLQRVRRRIGHDTRRRKKQKRVRLYKSNEHKQATPVGPDQQLTVPPQSCYYFGSKQGKTHAAQLELDNYLDPLFTDFRLRLLHFITEQLKAEDILPQNAANLAHLDYHETVSIFDVSYRTYFYIYLVLDHSSSICQCFISIPQPSPSRNRIC